MPRIRIQAKTPKGIRRGGVHHPPTAVVHHTKAFTKEQLEQIHNEVLLIVEHLDDEPDAPDAPNGADVVSGKSPAAVATPVATPVVQQTPDTQPLGTDAVKADAPAEKPGRGAKS